MLLVWFASAKSSLVVSADVLRACADGARHLPSRSFNPSPHSVHTPASRQRVQPSSQATQVPAWPTAWPYSPMGQCVLHVPPPRCRKSVAPGAHAVHAEAFAGDVHVLHVEWHGRHTPPLPPFASRSSAKPAGHVARQRPSWRMRDALPILQLVHACAPRPSQLAHVASQVMQDPTKERNVPLPQPSMHVLGANVLGATALSTGLIHGAGLHVWHTVGSSAEHSSQS